MAQGLGGRRLTRWLAPAAALLACATGCIPQIAVVDGKVFGNWVQLDRKGVEDFGRARSPGYGLQVEIAERGRYAPADVGRLVHDDLFPDAHRFTFNAEFARGDGESYTDPTSIWFNVFMGYYEVDVPREKWGRPFGYRIVDGEARVEPDDVLRIGRADWNYFSNYVYGVPLDVVRAAAHGSGDLRPLARIRGSARTWDLVELTGVDVLSAYVSGQDGQRLAQNACLYTDLWRGFFGQPHPPEPKFPVSFLHTRMRAKLFMTYWAATNDTHPIYKTIIFGGTVNDTYSDAAANERFLEAQLRSMAKIVARRFPQLDVPLYPLPHP